MTSCSLCDLIESITDPMYQDEICLFLIGRSRHRPMGVAKIHGMPIDLTIKSHIADTARRLFGNDVDIIDPMHSVTDHYHLHVYGVQR